MARPVGLGPAEVARRVAEGRVNELPGATGRTVAQILRANVLTRVNAILAVLLALVLATGSLINGAFGLLIIANSAVGVIQELRAKRTLERLSIVGRARPRVIRGDAAPAELDREQVVVDDLVALAAGEQVVVDGELIAARGLEVDESMLTGEAEPVAKVAGEEVLSGSHVVSGSAVYRATRVGAEAYAAQITAQARRFTLVDSELMAGIDQILRVITWLLVPAAALSIWTQLTRAEDAVGGWREAVLAMVASLVPMVPEGLVLMTSIAFAAGVVRLGKRRVLVNELPAIEGLARVSVVCADKTGTLTENRMRLGRVLDAAADPADAGAPEAAPGHPAWPALAALCQVEERPNATATAIREGLDSRGVADPGWAATAEVPFSSARKWSAARFGDRGTWVLGAPDVLADPAAGPGPALAAAAAAAGAIAAGGRRVLMLARAAGEPTAAGAPPAGLAPVALVVLEQTIRADARATLDYFAAEDVAVKVLSGDDAAGVGAVAAELGLPGADHPVDARRLPADPRAFAEAVRANGVFGRVSPERKREMVNALTASGETVAMTGDGVNDVLALKDAAIGVAMGSGAAATRSVAQLVLLDDRFAALPPVVAEGRRVIAAIERVANLFLTKTIYSVLLALLVGIAGVRYPFEPIHVTVIGWFTIGVPAFVLALAPAQERARPGFARRVLRLAAPAGAIAAAAVFGHWLTVLPPDGAPAGQWARAATGTLAVLVIVASWVLAVVARPYRWWKVALLAGCAAGYAAIFTVPALARVLRIAALEPGQWARAAAFALPAAAAVELVWRVGRRRAGGPLRPRGAGHAVNGD
ncbi:HAD-IC family P-type ATPase [Corynebacterium sphenisci]|uniref:HAD-IC family P-type ATPase n=1 Tax=Corynebacterium sphenisci TaxID=191493 RepID=UPI0009FDB858